MKHVWQSHQWVAIIISLVAIGISLFNTYNQYWPDDRTTVILSDAQFKIAEGRFGWGPRLLVVLNFVNRGNRPVIISSIAASFGFSNDGGAAANCTAEDSQWIGTPWDRVSAFGEKSFGPAMPSVIPPGAAVVAIYTFEPNSNRADQAAERHELMVCLRYKMINADLLPDESAFIS